MLADHVLDLGLGLVVERVIGRTHVGKFGVAALGVHHPRRQQRKFCRNRAERTVGMPQAVAEIEQMNTAVARQRLANLVEVGNIVKAGTKPGILWLDDIASARILALAEIQRERHLLLVGNVLIAEQQDGISVHAGLDVGGLLRRQRLPQIDAGNFAKKMRVKLPDRDRHGVSPDRGERIAPLRLAKKLLPDAAMSTGSAGHAGRWREAPSINCAAIFATSSQELARCTAPASRSLS